MVMVMVTTLLNTEKLFGYSYEPKLEEREATSMCISKYKINIFYGGTRQYLQC